MSDPNTDHVADAFRAALQLPANFAIRDEMSYDDLPGWDSLAHMRLVVELENRSGISLEMDEIAMIDSVRAARDVVARKKAD